MATLVFRHDPSKPPPGAVPPPPSPPPPKQQTKSKALPAPPKPEAPQGIKFVHDPTRAAVKEKPESHPGLKKPKGISDIVTSPLLETLGLPSFSEMYDKAARAVGLIVPEAKTKPDYVKTLVSELAKAGPETLDFFTSPLGIAIGIGLRLPQLRTITASLGVGIGILQAFKTIPSVSKAIKEPENPVAVADAIKDATYVALFARGGYKLAKAYRGHKMTEAEARAVMEQLRNLPPDDKRKLMDAISEADTPSKMFRKWVYRGPIRREIAAAIGVNKPELLEYSQYLVKDREAFLSTEFYKIDRILYEFRKRVPKADRDVTKLGFVIQGTKTPDDVGLGPEARKWIPILRRIDRYRVKLLKEVYGDDDAMFLDSDHYLTQIWQIPGRPDWKPVPKKLSVDPFMREREIMSYEEGMSRGLKPRFRDVADIIDYRHKTAITVVANRKLANWMAQMGFILPEEKAVKAGLANWKPAPDNVALRQAVGQKTGRVRVHPDVEQAVEAVFGEPIKFAPFYVLDGLRALGKQNAVMYSLFHHWALSEGAHALYLFREPKKVITETFAFNKRLWKGLKSGLWEVMGKTGDKPPVLEMKRSAMIEWLKAGLSVRSNDSEGALVRWLREKPAPFRYLGHLNYVFNRSLWDFYMQGGMLMSAETVFAKEMALMQRRLGRPLKPEEISSLRKAVADHINRVWGAENLETLLITPKMRQVLNWVLFAPLWTLSNLRILTAGFENETAARLTLKYIPAAFVSWFTGTQLVNYATTWWFNAPDKHGRRGGHFTWDNPGAPMRIGNRYVEGLTENAINIFAGWNPDGTETYIRFGKGYREPFTWALEPIETFAGKMSIPLRVFMTALTGSQPGTMFQAVQSRMPKEAIEMQRWAAFTELVSPFILQDLVDYGMRKMYPQYFREPTHRGQVFGLPTRKGITVRRSAEEYEAAIDAGRIDAAQQVLAAAVLNGIHPYRVIREYRARQRERIKVYQGIPVKIDYKGQPEVPRGE